MFSRNIGLISEEQQQKLAETTVLICGLGGMGGVCAEVLLRTGIGGFVLADHDQFEISNRNRQIHANTDTEGRFKVEVLAENMRSVNPDVRVRTETKGVQVETIEPLLAHVDIVVNGMDDMRSSLILERTARAKGLPIVDAWITPYASVFVMQPDGPHWEDFLDMPTRGVPVQELDDEICREALACEAEHTLAYGNPLELVNPQLISDVLDGRRPRPSLAPVVWLSGTLMANEVFKWVVGYPVTDHTGIMYDQYKHTMLQQKSNVIRLKRTG